MKLSIPQYHAHAAPIYNTHLMDMIHELNGHKPQHIKHISNNDRHYRHNDSKILMYIAMSTKHNTNNNKTRVLKQHTPLTDIDKNTQQETLTALLA